MATTLPRLTFMSWKSKKLKKWELFGNKTKPFPKCILTRTPTDPTHVVFSLLMDNLFQLIKFTLLSVIGLVTSLRIQTREQSRILTSQLQVFRLTCYLKRLQILRKSLMKKGHFSWKSPAIIGRLLVIMTSTFYSEVLQVETQDQKPINHHIF